jgi:diadenosine tetraphosphatase ApaH/serine/threonine PP2A family protein phosphatase
VLGDIVGYGPDPNEVIARVQALEPVAIVRGNHDKVACGIEQAEGFNAVAKSAALWTLGALTPEHRSWLAALPEGPILVDSTIEICHGSPFDEDVYIFDELDVIRALKVSQRPLCLYGHTHYLMTWELSTDPSDGTGLSATRDLQIPLREGFKYLVNPGSVGQPRDNDVRAAYAIVDTDRRYVELIRRDYRLDQTQDKIIKAGLPEMLAQRLGLGR